MEGENLKNEDMPPAPASQLQPNELGFPGLTNLPATSTAVDSAAGVDNLPTPHNPFSIRSMRARHEYIPVPTGFNLNTEDPYFYNPQICNHGHESKFPFLGENTTTFHHRPTLGHKMNSYDGFNVISHVIYGSYPYDNNQFGNPNGSLASELQMMKQGREVDISKIPRLCHAPNSEEIERNGKTLDLTLGLGGNSGAISELPNSGTSTRNDEEMVGLLQSDTLHSQIVSRIPSNPGPFLDGYSSHFQNNISRVIMPSHSVNGGIFPNNNQIFVPDANSHYFPNPSSIIQMPQAIEEHQFVMPSSRNVGSGIGGDRNLEYLRNPNDSLQGYSAFSSMPLKRLQDGLHDSRHSKEVGWPLTSSLSCENSTQAAFDHSPVQNFSYEPSMIFPSDAVLRRTYQQTEQLGFFSNPHVDSHLQPYRNLVEPANIGQQNPATMVIGTCSTSNDPSGLSLKRHALEASPSTTPQSQRRKIRTPFFSTSTPNLPHNTSCLQNLSQTVAGSVQNHPIPPFSHHAKSGILLPNNPSSSLFPPNVVTSQRFRPHFQTVLQHPSQFRSAQPRPFQSQNAPARARPSRSKKPLARAIPSRPQTTSAIVPPHKATSPIVPPYETLHIKWEGADDQSRPLGQKCLICKRDLSFTPEGPVLQPVAPPHVAVLPCGHTFHDHCLSIITPHDQPKDPPCIPCALGET